MAAGQLARLGQVGSLPTCGGCAIALWNVLVRRFSRIQYVVGSLPCPRGTWPLRMRNRYYEGGGGHEKTCPYHSPMLPGGGREVVGVKVDGVGVEDEPSTDGPCESASHLIHSCCSGEKSGASGLPGRVADAKGGGVSSLAIRR